MVLAQGTRGTWGVQTVFGALGWGQMERGCWKGMGLLLVKVCDGEELAGPWGSWQPGADSGCPGAEDGQGPDGLALPRASLGVGFLFSDQDTETLSRLLRVAQE